MAISFSHPAKFEIPYEKVLSRLGFFHGKTKIDPMLEDSLKEQIELAKKLVVVKYVIADSRIELGKPDETFLTPDFKLKSKDIHNLFHGCSKAVGFAVTIGGSLEIKRDLLIKEKHTSKALMLDAIGSVSVEEMTDQINKEITAGAGKENLSSSQRFSPGYGDWDISGQKDFLKWLSAEKIGIKLSDKFAMIPEKSVSAIIGLKQKQAD